MTLNWLDIVLIIICGGAVVAGFAKGFARVGIGFAATITGLLLGIFIKDFTTLFAVWKSGGIILFAPVVIYIFPDIPAWIGRIFPTYYIIQPVVDISQGGAGWPEIAVNVFILLGLDIAMTGALVATLRKTRQFAT